MKIAKLALTLVMLAVAPAWADEWVTCAIEDAYCRVDGTGTVRFGADNRWVTQKIQGGINCSRGAFGDPAPGVRKSCQVFVQRRAERREERRDERRDDRFDARTWVKCANEDGYCKVNGSEIVKYGAGNQWATRKVNGGVRCSPAAFGDPAVGVHKACYIVYQDDRSRRAEFIDPPTWVRCANEGGTCRFDGKRRVSYGHGNRWAYATGIDRVSCSPASFGKDPAPGVVKSCYYDSN